MVDCGEQKPHQSQTPDGCTGGHRLGRRTELPPVARLHLDEHHGRTVRGNDVDFATPPPVTPGKNRIPLRLERLNNPRGALTLYRSALRDNPSGSLAPSGACGRNMLCPISCAIVCSMVFESLE